MQMLDRIFVFLFGSIVGSFLNVCIFRMPNEGYSLLKPSSHCPSCKKNIIWYDNIPILSFLFLGGRCRFCKTKISPQYPLVEILTGLVFLVMYSRYGLSFDFVIFTSFSCALLVATFIDIGCRIIPDEISLGGMVTGLIFSLLKSIPEFSRFPKIAFVDSLLGAFLGGALIYASGLLGNLIFFKLMKKESIEGETESIGGGDVKLMAMIGSFIGWKLTLLAFFIAPFLGSIAGIYVLLFKKSHLIPYGPFLSLAALISLFFGDKIVNLLFL